MMGTPRGWSWIRNTVAGKITAVILVLVVVVAVNMVFSLFLTSKVSNRFKQVKGTDLQIFTYTQQAYVGFLNQDDQANMWVGLLAMRNAQKGLLDQTIGQAVAGQNQMNAALRALSSLPLTPQERSQLRLVNQDAAGYEGYFSLLRSVAPKDPAKGQDIMYVQNSGVSTALTQDLQTLKQLARTRLVAHADEGGAAASLTNLLAAVQAALVLLFGVLITWYAKRLVAPLSRISRLVERVASGDLTGEPVVLRRSDEVGSLAANTGTMVEGLKDLLRRISLASSQLAAASEQLSASAEETSSATEHVTGNIQHIAQGSDTQTQMARESAATIEKMSGLIRDISERAAVVNSAASSSLTHAQDGERAMQKVRSEMDVTQQAVVDSDAAIAQLHQHSNAVDQITNVISEIADQTNLLALNAAIEAARAGEQGAGFAVVADEVRRLAEQAKQSAEEIRRLIQDIQDGIRMSADRMNVVTQTVHSGVSRVQDASSAFSLIARSVEEVVTHAREMAGATEAALQSSGEVTATMRDMSAIASETGGAVQSVAAASEQQMASVQEVAASAANLSKMAMELQEAVSRFRT